MNDGLYSIIKALSNPLPLILFALLVARRRRWQMLAVLGLYLLSVQPIAAALTRTMQLGCPVTQDRPADIRAVVVLGAGVAGKASIGSVEPSAETALRLVHGIRLLKESNAPYLVLAGGAMGSSTDPEAQVMGSVAEQLGVEPQKILREDRSANTHEHAVNLSRWPLMQQGRLAVVTSAVHERRAVMNFRRYFADVIPYPAGCIPGAGFLVVSHWVPHTHNLHLSALAIYEMVGYVKDLLIGRREKV